MRKMLHKRPLASALEARVGRGADGSVGLLAVRIEQLALEESRAARSRDWKRATAKVVEKSRLQEIYLGLSVRRRL